MNAEPITVRRIKPEEWNRQREIRLRMLEEAPESFGATVEDESRIEDEDWQAWAVSRSGSLDEAMFVAVTGEEWVGCAIASRADHDQHVARVWGMWVEPNWRSRRIGFQLLQHVREWAVGSGYERMWLKVAETNLRAQRLYESFGFKATGERGGMRRDRTIQMITMEFDLA